MAYRFYLGKILLPIAPSKLQMKVNGKNKSMVLINDGEVNVLKKVGLTEITFDVRLPNVQYPFAKYKSGFKDAKYFLGEINKLKTSNKPFQFIVTRSLPNKKSLFDTNMKVSLESYDVKEDAKDGFDMVVSVKLKQYRSYGTKTCKIIEDDKKKKKASVEKKRDDETSPKPSKNQSKTHIVKSGDCLWNIAKYYYGDGTKNTVIYNANKEIIEQTARKYGRQSSSNGWWIYPNTKLTIPAL